MQFQQLGRLAYWQGQELRSRDLRDQSGSLEQLRWWHNRAAHGVFGVSQRLSVIIDPASQGVVNVDCGLAYDCFGRELLLSSPRTIPLPAVTDAQYLVLAYANHSAGLTWVPRNDFRSSSGVPLALFQVDSGAYRKDETFHAPTARALSRPHIGAGSTVPGNTSWETLPQDAGLKVVVDTSSAGFTRPPFYLASLNWLEENTDFTTPIVSVSDSSETGFTLRLLLKHVEEEFKVVSGAGLVKTLTIADRTFTLRKNINFGDGQSFQNDDIIARLLPQAQLAATITTVTGTTIGLTAPGLPLKEGDAVVLGRLPAVSTIDTAHEISGDHIPVHSIEGFSSGDLVTLETPFSSQQAILNGTDGKVLILKSPVENVAGLARNADFPVRSTVTTTMGDKKSFTVGDPSQFHINDVVALLKGMKVIESGVIHGITAGGEWQLSNPMMSLKPGEVLGVARFARTAVVGADPAQLAVPMKTVADANVFKAGDTVANLSSKSPLTLAVVDKVEGATVFLQTAIPGLASNNTLGIVALNVVALVDPKPGLTQFSVDETNADDDAVRAGGIVAPLTGWIDASLTAPPVHIQDARLPIRVEALPDGLSTGDAVGFAALSPKQPAVRFESGVQSQLVVVAGVDEKSRTTVEVAAVAIVDGKFAILDFHDGDFALRPEALTITGRSPIEDFLAYAQRKGLNVCWLGCQMPAAEAAPCPALVAAPCGCK